MRNERISVQDEETINSLAKKLMLYRWLGANKGVWVKYSCTHQLLEYQ